MHLISSLTPKPHGSLSSSHKWFTNESDSSRLDLYRFLFFFFCGCKCYLLAMFDSLPLLQGISLSFIKAIYILCAAFSLTLRTCPNVFTVTLTDRNEYYQMYFLDLYLKVMFCFFVLKTFCIKTFAFFLLFVGQ